MTTNGTLWAAPYRRAERRSLAVIGGGVVGLSTAYAAARRGAGRVKVSLYDQAEVGHKDAASADVNRIFRYLNGPEDVLVDWAGEADAMWRALGEQFGRTLLHDVGLLLLIERGGAATDGPGGHVQPYASEADWMEDALAVMRWHGAPYERLNGATVERRYPQFNATAIAEAAFDPQAGYLLANLCLRALLSQALAAGVRYYPNARVAAIDSDDAGCRLALDGGAEARADAVVVAANGWTPDLLPELKRRLTLNEQPVIYLNPPPFAEAQSLSDMPVFISLSSDCYGFPVMEGEMKIANDNPYRPIERPEHRVAPTDEHCRQTLAAVSRWLPAISEASVARTHTCFYDRSPDGRFILDVADGAGRVVYGCGMSGRAFKFGPVLGERLARYAIEAVAPRDIASFRHRWPT